MTPDRQRLLAQLAELSDRCPQMRFGQLIANLAMSARGPAAEAVWEVEDTEMFAAAERQVAYWLNRQPDELAVAQ